MSRSRAPELVPQSHEWSCSLTSPLPAQESITSSKVLVLWHWYILIQCAQYYRRCLLHFESAYCHFHTLRIYWDTVLKQYLDINMDFPPDIGMPICKSLLLRAVLRISLNQITSWWSWIEEHYEWRCSLTSSLLSQPRIHHQADHRASGGQEESF